jgi:hypothetical protein
MNGCVKISLPLVSDGGSLVAENNKDKLPHLASEIKSGLDLAEKGKQDRIKGLVDAAIALRGARLLFKADVRFSQWCADKTTALL